MIAIAGAAAGAVGLLAALAAIWLLATPPAAPDPGRLLAFDPSPSGAVARSSSPTMLVIDVEGGVASPGVHRLPGGSRVADALAAAGGYARGADLARAAAELNLAATLDDGQQIYVPLLGASGAPAPSGAVGGGGAGGTGQVNLNRATPEALEALPGIGPVTVQKIVAARQDRAFSTLDELVERKVLSQSQLDKIRDQVTV